MTINKPLGTVGENGTNALKDVKLIQSLLNVYFRKNKKTTLIVNGKNNSSLESSISNFQKDHMKMSSPDSKVSPHGKTFSSLKAVLAATFKAIAVVKPSYGEVTWESEGAEGGLYHTRKFHVPSPYSGLTIGRGYDMKTKSASAISIDLIGAGVDANKVAIIKHAAGLFGDSASNFIIDKDLLDFQLTPDAQKKLFKISYDIESANVKRISEKKDVVLKYGKTDWSQLHSAIKDIAVDLKFRGDYTGASRKVIQKSIADNDFEEFKKLLNDKNNWGKVPKDRFERRNNFLGKAK